MLRIYKISITNPMTPEASPENPLFDKKAFDFRRQSASDEFLYKLWNAFGGDENKCSNESDNKPF